MRVLLIKTSSMGDLIHTLPALSDARLAIPSITFDWVVEESFSTIPSWHSAVRNIIPVALRKWRKGLFNPQTWRAWKELVSALHKEQYDLILDAQGLVKSAFLTFFAKGARAGLDRQSAREGLASIAYQHKYNVNFYQHAVVRMRALFSLALNYPLSTEAPNFGIRREEFATNADEEKSYVIFLHGTTWSSKEWPENYWVELAKIAAEANFRIKISGGNAEEMARAHRIANASSAVEVLPYLSIENMAKCLANAKAVIAVDTGLGHLAAALNVPTISLYGATNPQYTGALGQLSKQMAASFECAPCLNRSCTYKKASGVMPACYATLSPQKVWQAVSLLMYNRE